MNESKRILLINALINRPIEHNLQLSNCLKEATIIAQKKDWLWHCLLSSMATMGNSRGHVGLILNNTNYQLVSYNNLLQLNNSTRLSNLITGLRLAKVRRYNSKANWLINNFTLIQDCGGINILQNLLLEIKGRDSKIKMIKIFDGIGDKYARNIFMEINHSDFINSIAIDERIADISEELEINSSSMTYQQHENIFIQIANESALTPWQVDRLLYFFKEHYLRSMTNGV